MPEIMIPLVSTEAEIKLMKHLVIRIAKKVPSKSCMNSTFDNPLNIIAMMIIKDKKVVCMHFLYAQENSVTSGLKISVIRLIKPITPPASR